MSTDVVCLRPKDDFLNIGVTPPESLSIRYMAPTDADLVQHLATARALVIPAVGPKLDAKLFAGSRIELIQVTGAGIDRLDADAMKAKGIAIANVPGGSSTAIAEYAVSSALALLRRTFWADGELRKGLYVDARRRMVSENLAGLEGLTVGVVGLGVIGMTVAQTFHSLGSRIVYHDPAPRDADAVSRIDAVALPLNELLAAADIVTLHVPLLPSTASMLGERELGQMKAGAILINAARGGIVDEAALVQYLANGHLGGAAVDVYSSEPPAEDNPLITAGDEVGRRLLLTPHIAGVTRQAWANLFSSAWDNVERLLLHDEPPVNRVI
ncbi:MAG: NAD(P)-binding domain-containing protein [Gammaproteobacteria bacterium]|nr:NAD(P)-binding domain-containing protein [Gammaproteobacteria bacterium]MDH3414714.1 NAD(P)-binding domain-containing protein [Gammaproteobacteria bacterium]